MQIQYRTTASAGDGLDFVISDGSRDRHGTRINPNGWDLRAFKLNPVALFSHGKDPVHGQTPIGTWTNIRIEGGKLISRFVRAAVGTSQRVDELCNLVEQRILRAVSAGFVVLENGKPPSEFDFEKQELLEVSITPVGSNKNALAMARSMNISESTISLAFGEQADTRRRDVSDPGKQAAKLIAIERPMAMTTRSLSQKIEDLQNELNSARDKVAELNAAEVFDKDAIDEANTRVDALEGELVSRKASEALVGQNATRSIVEAPAINRRPLGVGQREVSGLDLLIRHAVVKSCALWTGRDLDKILDERYPGQEATAAIVRAAQTIGTTTVAGWVLELQQTTYSSLVEALRGKSIYPQLRDKGRAVSFDSAGTAYIPSLTAGGANGSFFAEGTPMRVGRITTAATTMTARKMGVIIPFSREAAKRSTPNLEQLVRKAIVDDTAAILDGLLLDAVAGDTVRPAGLLNGVAATAAGFGGGDFEAVITDFKTLLAPFISANAADNITVIMNPAQGLALSFMPGADGRFGWFSEMGNRFSIVESTYATAGRLIAIRNSDFITALGDAPDFELSNQATIHMEDTTPLEIVSATGPTTANPVRSFFQTDSMGVRMVMDVAWKMARTGMVRWIDGTSW